MNKQEYTPMSKEALHAIKVGDIVERMLAFSISMPLRVTEVTEKKIECGWWEFDRDTGLEIDKDISHRVSYLRKVYTKEEIKEKVHFK